MKIFKILLSLHSIKLILISVLVITYMVTTAANSSNKTEVVKEGSAVSASEEGDSVRVDNADSMDAKIEINAITFTTAELKIEKGDKK